MRLFADGRYNRKTQKKQKKRGRSFCINLRSLLTTRDWLSKVDNCRCMNIHILPPRMCCGRCFEAGVPMIFSTFLAKLFLSWAG